MAGTGFMTVSIVIVSHDSGHILGDCLGHLPSAAEIIVVDNASSDDARSVARSHDAQLIGLSENVGYGRACNIGVRAASRELVLIMNPDVRLEADAIAKLTEAAECYPQAAAFTPRLIEPNGKVVFHDASVLGGAPRKTRKYKSSPKGDCGVEIISGAAMLCRRDIFLSVGGFDERIFLYYEDDDLCFRLRKAGWSLVYVNAATGRHEHGKSTRSKRGATFFRSFHWAVSKEYVTRKHGIPFHPHREWFKATFRGCLAVLRRNSTRRERYFGLAAGFRWAIIKKALETYDTERAKDPVRGFSPKST
jgi:N-acetylglucosaminyl-diphospho-decaprenol L-rhamnosyltransferase